MKGNRFKYLLFSGLLLLCLILAAGCEKIDLSGKNGESGKKPSETPVDNSRITVKTTVDGEFTFRPTAATSTQSERLIREFEELEQKHGIQIDVEILTGEQMSSGMLRAMRAEKPYADLIQTDTGTLSDWYGAGYLLPIENAGLSETETGTLKKDGVAYGFRSEIWNTPRPTVSYLLYYNQKLLNNAGCEDPQELQEKGYWNWDEFLQICKEVTKPETEGGIYAIAGITSEETELMWAALRSAGAVYFDSDGTCVMDSNETVTGFVRLRELLNAKVTYTLAHEGNSGADETAKLAFTNRRTAFLVGNSSLLFETGEGSISEELNEDLRITAFPRIGSSTATAAFTETDIFCAVPRGANTELCRTVLPELFSGSEPQSALKELSDDLFYYEQDANLYQQLLRTAQADSRMQFGNNRPLVEEYFIKIADGGSAKEILENFQKIINAKEG